MSSNSSGNRVNVPEAKNALDNMKYEVARELGINLKKGYNGNLSAAITDMSAAIWSRR